MVQTTAFILGATGYIGGSVLVDLTKKYPDFVYSALVRNPKDNNAIEALGVKIVQGSHTNFDLIEKSASESDIVFNFADCDDLPLTEAILRGMKTRGARKDGTKKPILIHTSGTGVVTHKPGDPNDRLYDDLKVEDIKSIGPNQIHRPVDLKIFEAGDEGSIDTYIIAPSVIYGKGHGPVRIITIAFKLFLKTFLQNKQAFQPGTDTIVWDSVHIDDIVDLYFLVIEQALTPSPIRSAYERFYWGSSASFQWDALITEIAVRLHKKGLLSTAEVKKVPLEDYPNLAILSKNSRTVSNRALKTLGWAPHGRSLMESLDDEIDLTLSQL
ncbi:hypothetical protein FRB94_010919 [Tulasnella sp. JGI-2019a]|nr:hypothetical protein FRB94_010919 [Tulasnella sp. JGI-2019a]KAG9030542.1 hypothetical protein FRB95_003871 [Tulasnella sp. JGI-2019a]